MDREARDFWRRQRRAAARERARGPWRRGTGTPVTVSLIVLMVLVFLLENLAPGWVAVLGQLPLWPVIAYVLSALSAQSLLGLVFMGLFVYVLGSQLEHLDEPWKYVLIFLGSGVVSAWVLGHGAAAVVPSFAGFGLAGAYAYTMYGTGFGDVGVRWAVGLLLLNAVLGGFRAYELLGMASAFASGAVLSYLLRFGGARGPLR